MSACQYLLSIQTSAVNFTLIGASVSEPHTSDLNSGISLIYVYIYMYRTSCVQCAHICAAYRHYTSASTTHAHLESSVLNNSSVCFATCSEQMNTQSNTSRKAPETTTGRQAMAQERTREGLTYNRDSQAKINEAEGE